MAKYKPQHSRLLFVDRKIRDGEMTVGNETACWHQYMDMTMQSEALYEFVNKTIERKLVEELRFLVSYDNTKMGIQGIIDRLDRFIDLCIQPCLQKSESLFAGKDLLICCTDHFSSPQ